MTQYIAMNTIMSDPLVDDIIKDHQFKNTGELSRFVREYSFIFHTYGNYENEEVEFYGVRAMQDTERERVIVLAYCRAEKRLYAKRIHLGMETNDVFSYAWTHSLTLNDTFDHSYMLPEIDMLTTAEYTRHNLADDYFRMLASIYSAGDLSSEDFFSLLDRSQREYEYPIAVYDVPYEGSLKTIKASDAVPYMIGAVESKTSAFYDIAAKLDSGKDVLSEIARPLYTMKSFSNKTLTELIDLRSDMTYYAQEVRNAYSFYVGDEVKAKIAEAIETIEGNLAGIQGELVRHQKQVMSFSQWEKSPAIREQAKKGAKVCVILPLVTDGWRDEE